MFKDTKAFQSFSVNDVEKAKKFYGETLGIEVAEKTMGEGFTFLELHIANSNPVFVYPKPDHTPASFTILNFPVADLEKAVEELKQAGVQFEQYDLEFLKTDEKGIARGDGTMPAIAWFKDPAGNVLAVTEEKK